MWCLNYCIFLKDDVEDINYIIQYRICAEAAKNHLLVIKFIKHFLSSRSWSISISNRYTGSLYWHHVCDRPTCVSIFLLTQYSQSPVFCIQESFFPLFVWLVEFLFCLFVFRLTASHTHEVILSWSKNRKLMWTSWNQGCISLAFVAIGNSVCDLKEKTFLTLSTFQVDWEFLWFCCCC